MWIYQNRLPQEGFLLNLNCQNSKQTPKGFSLSGQKVNSQKESRKNRRPDWLSKKSFQREGGKSEIGKFSEGQYSSKAAFKNINHSEA